MSWNLPQNVSTGTNLTATLWNNLLGLNGSMMYLFNQQKAVVLSRSVSTSIAANSSYTINFDSIPLNNGFETTVPTTNINVPITGLYVYAFVHAFNVNTQVLFRMVQTSNSAELSRNYIPTSSTVSYNTFSGIALLNSSNTFNCIVSITTASTMSAFSGLYLARISN